MTSFATTVPPFLLFQNKMTSTHSLPSPLSRDLKRCHFRTPRVTVRAQILHVARAGGPKVDDHAPPEVDALKVEIK